MFDDEEFGEGPMATNNSEQWRARMTIVPFSSWIRMLEMSGSVSRLAAAEDVSVSWRGRDSSTVPFERRGEYRAHREAARVACARSVEAGLGDEDERSFPVGVSSRRVCICGVRFELRNEMTDFVSSILGRMLGKLRGSEEVEKEVEVGVGMDGVS